MAACELSVLGVIYFSLELGQVKYQSNKHLAWVQVFDGHGGTSAAEYARMHLLSTLLAHSSFPGRPAEAMVRFIVECCPAGSA